MQAASGWIYILVGIFALIYNLTKVAGQKAKQKPASPQNRKPEPEKSIRDLLDELVLSNQGNSKQQTPNPPPQTKPVFTTMETIRNEADDDSEMQIESDYQQYEHFSYDLKSGTIQHPPQAASGETAFPSETDLVAAANTPTSIFADGTDIGKAMIYGDILNNPKWRER